MNGKSTGEADVEFRCHEDAVAAMSKDKNHMRTSTIFFPSQLLVPRKADRFSHCPFTLCLSRAPLHWAISKLDSQRSSRDEWVASVWSSRRLVGVALKTASCLPGRSGGYYSNSGGSGSSRSSGLRGAYWWRRPSPFWAILMFSPLLAPPPQQATFTPKYSSVSKLKADQKSLTRVLAVSLLVFLLVKHPLF